jgi:CubicO group peptidase (beta-lactamase class C family)
MKEKKENLSDVCYMILFFCIVGHNTNAYQYIDEYVRTEMKKQKIPGLSMAIIRNNQIVYGQGYGYSNVEHQVPVKLETIFQSGSMGKQFIAMAIMILVERGEVELDERVKEYIEDVPKGWKNITVRHLLTHTAGTGDYPDDFDYRADMDEDDMWELIKTIPLDFKAGEQYSYSNLGFITLGILIRQVTGEFYGDFLKKNIFEPLGMKTARVISESDIVLNRASGYELVDGKIKNQEWVSPSLNTFADGALYINIYDMAKYETGLNSNLLLKKRESFDQMWSPVKLNDKSTYPYGFGWCLDETVSGMRVVKHGGTWQGFESYVIRILNVKVTIAIFANLDEADVEKIASHVLEMYDPQFALKSNQEGGDDENEDDDGDGDEDEDE